VTFLFTDIEGSTRRWEADAEAMRAALSKHDQVLRTAIESHDGFLFSHTGDGVVAAFASPRSAVDAAVTAQLALELPVRMGIATGEAELRDGDYFGTVLNRAARVMAAGQDQSTDTASRSTSIGQPPEIYDQSSCNTLQLAVVNW
jgi:class 3 adenylate cyclase